MRNPNRPNPNSGRPQTHRTQPKAYLPKNLGLALPGREAASPEHRAPSRKRKEDATLKGLEIVMNSGNGQPQALKNVECSPPTHTSPSLEIKDPCFYERENHRKRITFRSRAAGAHGRQFNTDTWLDCPVRPTRNKSEVVGSPVQWSVARRADWLDTGIAYFLTLSRASPPPLPHRDHKDTRRAP